MKRCKKILAFVLLVVLSVTSVGGVKTTVQAAEGDTTEKTGYSQMKRIDLGEVGELPEEPEVQYSRYAASKWDKCSSRYFYNQLNSAQKNLYDSMYILCMTYLITGMDAVSYNSSTGFTEVVAAPNLTQDQAQQVLFLFVTNNPQFYFINEYYGMGTSNGTNCVRIGIYPEWVSGGTRAATTARFSETMDSWIVAINSEVTLLDKEKKAHDLIVQNTVYDYGAYNQSCAGILLEGKGVCAAYAETFALLCNSVGINTVCVTSQEHEWNLVQFGDKWYNVDCTWDDPDSGSTIYYNYFNVSDSAISEGYHELESVWDNLNVPSCYSNSVDISGSYWLGDRYIVNGVTQSNVFLAPVRENPSTQWYYFAYSTADANAGTSAYEIRTGWLRDEQTGRLHFAFPENGLLMANMWSSDHKYYFDGLDLAIGKFVANDGYTYFSYGENAVINGQHVTGIVQSGWVMDEQTGDLYFCFPENCRMARGITLGKYVFDESGKCLNPF